MRQLSIYLIVSHTKEILLCYEKLPTAVMSFVCVLVHVRRCRIWARDLHGKYEWVFPLFCAADLSLENNQECSLACVVWPGGQVAHAPVHLFQSPCQVVISLVFYPRRRCTQARRWIINGIMSPSHSSRLFHSPRTLKTFLWSLTLWRSAAQTNYLRLELRKAHSLITNHIAARPGTAGTLLTSPL